MIVMGKILLKSLWEKIPFFILSAVFSMITLYAQHKPSQEYLPLGSRLANDPVSFMIYLEKTFVPNHMAVFYPFSFQLPLWQVWGSVFLLLFISVSCHYIYETFAVSFYWMVMVRNNSSAC